VASVTVTDLDDACAGKSISVYLTDGSAQVGSTATGTVTDDTGDTDINSTLVTGFGTGIDAEDVALVAVEIG
jgi:hypothetical protein